MSPQYRYEIQPRPLELGGGWRTRLFDGDVEVGGGVFPLAQYEAAKEPSKAAYAEALDEATAWLASRDDG